LTIFDLVNIRGLKGLQLQGRPLHPLTGALAWNPVGGSCPDTQWRRSVVKYGGRDQSDQAIKLFQAPRKISFRPTFRFLTQVFYPWWVETCKVI